METAESAPKSEKPIPPEHIRGIKKIFKEALSVFVDSEQPVIIPLSLTLTGTKGLSLNENWDAFASPPIAPNPHDQRALKFRDSVLRFLKIKASFTPNDGNNKWYPITSVDHNRQTTYLYQQSPIIESVFVVRAIDVAGELLSERIVIASSKTIEDFVAKHPNAFK